MKWDQLCDDPALENLAYRVELARHGQLVMSPHSSYHSVFQSRIIRHLNRLLPAGEAMPGCPIETGTGTLVADVGWASSTKVERNVDLPSWAESPEIVVEVLPPSNLEVEIRKKRHAVFGRGASEFWVCDRAGVVRFWGTRGRLVKSRLCLDFPASVAVNSFVRREPPS